MRIKITLLSLLLFVAIAMQAQDAPPVKRVYSSIHVTEHYLLKNTQEWSLPGLQYQLYINISDRIGIETELGFIKWDDFDVLVLPLLTGPAVTFASTNKFNYQLVLQAGPSANIGNDYGSIFATVETGFRMRPVRGKNISIAVYWGQSMAFHPDHFAFAGASLGYVF